jgi:hypothetical protein
VHPSGRVALSIGRDKTIRAWDLMQVFLDSMLDLIGRLICLLGLGRCVYSLNLIEGQLQYMHFS